MTVVWFALTAPVLYAFWLALSTPQYEWIGTILPLVIAFGAPVAYIVTGYAGPRLGRRVSELFTQAQRDRNAAAPAPSSDLAPSSDRLELKAKADLTVEVAKQSVTITPPAASMEAGTSAPKVLLVSASDDIKVRVRDMLSTCDVVVAATSAQALLEIRAALPQKVIFDASKAGRVPDVLEIARVLGVGLVDASLVLFAYDKRDAERLRLTLKGFTKSKEHPPIVDLETLRSEVLR
jgi:hypothetical protein